VSRLREGTARRGEVRQRARGKRRMIATIEYKTVVLTSIPKSELDLRVFDNMLAEQAGAGRKLVGVILGVSGGPSMHLLHLQTRTLLDFV
jgi:hypothetical protein